MSKRLKISRAEDAGSLRIRLWFTDDTQQTVDVGSFIRSHPHPQYNHTLFNTFQLVNGNIVWGEDWDLIFPVEQLHRGVVEGEVVEG